MFKVAEALEMILNDDNNDRDMVILPPDVDELTDEEQIDDDDLDQGPPAEIPGTLEIIDPESDSDDEQLYQIAPEKGARVVPDVRTWVADKKVREIVPDNLQGKSLAEMNQFLEALSDASPTDLFMRFYDNEIIDLIISESIRYARQKNDNSFSLTRDELYQFLGFAILTGYHQLPRERMYFSNDEDIKVELVSNTFQRGKFLKIKKNLHVANNELLTKLTK